MEKRFCSIQCKSCRELGGESNSLLKKRKKESVQSNARAVEGESNLLLWSPAPPTALTPLSTFNLAIASIIVNFHLFLWSVTTHFYFCYCTVILYWYHASHLDLSKSSHNLVLISVVFFTYIDTSIISTFQLVERHRKEDWEMSKAHLEAQDDVSIAIFLHHYHKGWYQYNYHHHHYHYLEAQDDISIDILSSSSLGPAEAWELELCLNAHIFLSDAEVQHAGCPGGSAEGAWRDVRARQQGDEEHSGQGIRAMVSVVVVLHIGNKDMKSTPAKVVLI